MRVAIDTNILLYAEGLNDGARRAQATAVIAGVRHRTLVVPAQVLGEFYRALRAKRRLPATEARIKIIGWIDLVVVAPTDDKVLVSAVTLATDHQLHIFDAIVLASAAAERCRLLLSEDLQDGFVWGGVTVVNPFADIRHPLLEAALRPHGRQ